jgi:ribosomal protein S18 acetylase RimI-like enzyme
MAPPYQPHLRAATPADAEALSALAERTFVETFIDGFGIPYPPDDLAAFKADVFSLEATRERLVQPGHVWEVAELDGRIVAFSEIGPASMPHPDLRPEHAELKRLYVAGEAQGLGLGRTLLENALARMDERPGPQWLSVWSGNDKAQRLYRHHGFDKAGEYEFPVGSWRDHEFIFRRG